MNRLYFVYDKVSEDVIMCGLAPTGGAFVRANARLAQSFNPNFERDFDVYETFGISCFGAGKNPFKFDDVDHFTYIPWSSYKNPDHPDTVQPQSLEAPLIPKTVEKSE